ncbi:hypothetical protein AB0K16_19380 [Nonomuraea jabiensis]|uniref:hypothetical protein n=1 Tax=Nonomuraea jabiensis TaxID=882448 RepID=UPI00343B66D5
MANLELPEFDAWQEQSGMYRARHKETKREIEADTWARLELLACAVQIGVTLSESAGVRDPDRPPDIDWRPYHARATRSRVREYVTRGAVEYELCVESGQYVIRRTDRRRKNRTTVSEVGREQSRQATLALWRLIMNGDAD